MRSNRRMAFYSHCLCQRGSDLFPLNIQYLLTFSTTYKMYNRIVEQKQFYMSLLQHKIVVIQILETKPYGFVLYILCVVSLCCYKYMYNIQILFMFCVIVAKLCNYIATFDIFYFIVLSLQIFYFIAFQFIVYTQYVNMFM